MAVEPAVALARRARRVGLTCALWRMREKLTLERLDRLLDSEQYGSDIAELKIDDITAWSHDASPLLARPTETIHDAILRVFEAFPDTWLASGFFVRHVGLKRWTAQAELAKLAELGFLERTGTTSGTRYRLVPTRAPVRSETTEDVDAHACA